MADKTDRTAVDSDATDDNEIEDGHPAPMDFNLFVLSLNASALMHLGEPSGRDDGAEVNLPMARQTIDMIALLEEKTRGNLTGQEEQLLHQVLFDLRMRFANRVGAGHREPSDG
ncbi:MAG: DUF1844 domain-containing protein [Myxococcales bacterium]|nr:DUF1844 domain-containing protein [Myxococcales bacterium]